MIIDDITKFIFINDQPKKSDIIFIPGGSYPEIAETASKLLNNGYCDFALPSGRFGANIECFKGPKSKSNIYNKKYKTECEFLTDVLIKNKVDERKILKEDKATYTYENAIYSRKLTDSLGMDIKSAIICCKSFHARRCLMYYKIAYPNTTFIVCSTDVNGINKDNWFKSRVGIDKVMGEVERCGSQFKDILESEYGIVT